MDELNVGLNEHVEIPKSGDAAFDGYLQNLADTRGLAYLKAVVMCAKLGGEIAIAPEGEKKALIDKASILMAFGSMRFEGDEVAKEIMKEAKELWRIGRGVGSKEKKA